MWGRDQVITFRLGSVEARVLTLNTKLDLEQHEENAWRYIAHVKECKGKGFPAKKEVEVCYLLQGSHMVPCTFTVRKQTHVSVDRRPQTVKDRVSQNGKLLGI